MPDLVSGPAPAVGPCVPGSSFPNTPYPNTSDPNTLIPNTLRSIPMTQIHPYLRTLLLTAAFLSALALPWTATAATGVADGLPPADGSGAATDAEPSGEEAADEADETTATPDQPRAVTQVASTAPAEVIFDQLMVVGGPARISEVPGSAHVLGAEELEEQDHSDIHRVLRQVPGVFVQEEEGFGLRPNIGMRGTGTERSSKITLLEDGVLIAPAPYAAPSAYYFPTAGRMQGIEVRKGSASIRQGPYTNGGVLNMISTAIPSSFQGKVDAAAGEHGTGRLHAFAGDTRGQLGWMVETYQMRSDGFKDLDGGGDTGFDLEDYTGKLRWTTGTDASVYQAVEMKVGRTEQLGQETYLGLTQADFEATPYRRYAGSQEDEIDTEHEQLQLSWLLAPSDGFDLTTTVYRNDFFRNWHKLQSVNGVGISSVLGSPGSFGDELAILRGDADAGDGALKVRNNRRDYYSQGVQSVAAFRFGTGGVDHRLELGARYHEDEEDRFQEEDRFRMVGGQMELSGLGVPGSQANRVSSAEALALFVQDRIVAGRWTFTPGIRFESVDFTRVDYSEDDPTRTVPSRVRENGVDEWIPGLGIDYALSDQASVFAGVHRGFSPPGPGRSAETRSEESVNYELGWRRVTTGGNVQVVAFYNDYENLLGRDTLSSGGNGSGDLFNGGQVEVQGLELSAARTLDDLVGTWVGAVRDGAISVPVRLSYTYTDASFQNTFESDFGPWGPVVFAGDELPYLPQHQVALGTGVEAQRWAAFFDLSWVGETRTEAGQGAIPAGSGTDAHFLVDLSTRFNLLDGLALNLQVRNLTDEVYVAARRPAGARPGLPRTALLGLSWNF